MTVLLFVAGLAALVAGAEALVRGASRLALSLGISPLVVGLTVVAFGTSAPEMAVTVGAALGGRTDVAVANVVGSNVINVLLILGLSATIAPLVVHVQVIRQEVPVMIGATVIFLALVRDGALGRAEGVLLVALLAAYLVLLIRQARGESRGVAGEASEAGWPRGRGGQLALVAAGLLLLVLGARWMVDAAVAFARTFGVSDTVIGLTVVAVGTSLPEVATSVAAAVRGERDIAVGNVVGSNVFNVLGCLGVAAVVSGEGLPVAPAILNFDVWVMLAVALACLPVFLTGREIARWEGALFLGYFVAYMAYLLLAARQHDALPAFSTAMLSFAIPLTVVTLLVGLLRRPEAGASEEGRDLR